jgi:hypothetical protein
VLWCFAGYSFSCHGSTELVLSLSKRHGITLKDFNLKALVVKLDKLGLGAFYSMKHLHYQADMVIYRIHSLQRR